MDSVFIDTAFVVALINQNDVYHSQAVELSRQYENRPMITTNIVLLEIGNALARNHKHEAIQIIEAFRSSDDVTIVDLNKLDFEKAFEIYKRYDDKSWGLVDCISFVVMRNNNVTDVLTSDMHFGQAGFNVLMQK